MGFFSSIAESVKNKMQQSQQEVGSARTIATSMRTDELMYIIKMNPKKQSILVISAYTQELKRRMGSLDTNRLKMEFNEASRRNNMQALILYGNELVDRGCVKKEGGFYTKIGSLRVMKTKSPATLLLD